MGEVVRRRVRPGDGGVCAVEGGHLRKVIGVALGAENAIGAAAERRRHAQHREGKQRACVHCCGGGDGEERRREEKR